MPLLQNQLESSPPEAEIAGRCAAEFRPIVALAFVAGVLIPGSIALVEHGVATWVAAAIAIYVAGSALHRIGKERALLSGRATTIATVTHWEKAGGPEGGEFYSVRYRFLGPDGKKYTGKATSQVELPHDGEMIPISFMRVDPTENLPLATFWFYRFTYSGFAKWMD
jgi:hypothetical protein